MSSNRAGNPGDRSFGSDPSVAGLASQGGQHGRPLFVVIDGVDGCGKSTQARMLVKHLEKKGPRGCATDRGQGPVHLREPGSTDLGERVRELLLDRGLHLEAEVETLLFAAARRQMLDQLARPALLAGRDVVCERFHASTFAYQAVAGNLEEDQVLELLHGWASDPKPDLIVLLEVSVEDASRRRGAATDRIEDKGTDFQRKVAEGYRIYARRDSSVVVVDGSQDANQVALEVARIVDAAREGDKACS